MLVNNDDVVRPGFGFETHPHRDMEIVTWVMQSAGTGILHSKKNDSWRLQGEEHHDPVHFVQMSVEPDQSGITPGYEQLEVDDALLNHRDRRSAGHRHRGSRGPRVGEMHATVAA